VVDNGVQWIFFVCFFVWMVFERLDGVWMVFGTESDRVFAAVNHEADDAVTEARDSKAYGGVSGGVAGILYKWVNYRKGRRSRWFALEDGVKEKMRIY
jgi:hypothetical protein